MPGPMEGVWVVEVGMWVAGPAAAGILGDWGADVVKIEPPDGDPFRAVLAMADLDVNPPFELDNRNKRSVALNLATDEGRTVAAELVDRADVFVTNARPGALARAGLDHETVSARNPRLVYAHVNGYGLAGDEKDRAAYDVGAFWSRAGVAASLTPDGQPLPYQRGGMGDHMAGLAAAGAVSAALFARERTGEGQLVSVSLLRIGLYMVGWDVNMALRMGVPTIPISVAQPPNPLISAYEAAMRDYGFAAVKRSLQISTSATSSNAFSRLAFRTVLRAANRLPWLRGMLFTNRDVGADRLARAAAA